jgi:hypothetical protein
LLLQASCGPLPHRSEVPPTTSLQSLAARFLPASYYTCAPSRNGPYPGPDPHQDCYWPNDTPEPLGILAGASRDSTGTLVYFVRYWFVPAPQADSVFEALRAEISARLGTSPQSCLGAQMAWAPVGWYVRMDAQPGPRVIGGQEVDGSDILLEATLATPLHPTACRGV